MTLAGVTAFLAKKAPLIVGGALVAAVAGARLEAARWAFYLLSLALVLAAALLWWRRGRTRLLKSKEQLGFQRNRDILWFEFMAKGLPDEYFGLTMACFVAVLLTSMRWPYVAAVIAATLLNMAWGQDRRRYPAEEPLRDED